MSSLTFAHLPPPRCASAAACTCICNDAASYAWVRACPTCVPCLICATTPPCMRVLPYMCVLALYVRACLICAPCPICVICATTPRPCMPQVCITLTRMHPLCARRTCVCACVSVTKGDIHELLHCANHPAFIVPPFPCAPILSRVRARVREVGVVQHNGRRR